MKMPNWTKKEQEQLDSHPANYEKLGPTRPTRRSKVAAVASYVVIGMALMLLALFTYWQFEPDQVYRVEDHLIAVVPPVAKAGEEVTVSFSFCKLIEKDGIVTRSFVGEGTEVLSPPVTEHIGKTCLNDVEVMVLVPAQLAPGEYRIKYTGEYEINPIKSVIETHYSERFEVVAGE